MLFQLYFDCCWASQATDELGDVSKRWNVSFETQFGKRAQSRITIESRRRNFYYYRNQPNPPVLVCVFLTWGSINDRARFIFDRSLTKVVASPTPE